jgi:N,N'-diacetyllegionaminate synthase
MKSLLASFQIGSRPVGDDQPPLIIAEVAQAHDGSLGTAHAFIDAVAETGVEAIKFQTHIAASESSNREPFRVKFSKQDDTRYDYWKRMEFKQEQWLGLAEHARQRGLIFISSPFSVEAVDLLEKVGMPCWKIASGETGNPFILERILKTENPVLLSTGLSDWQEIDALVSKIKINKNPLLVMQCTTQYPVQPERLGLNLISEIKLRYGTPAGLSDHSGHIYPGLAAIVLGASAIEVHVTLDRRMFGPDIQASLTPEELTQLAEGSKFLWTALQNPGSKDILSLDQVELRSIFGRSIYLLKDLKKGERIQEKDISARKPGDGIPASRVNEIIGKTIRRDIQGQTFLKEEDFE